MRRRYLPPVRFETRVSKYASHFGYLIEFFLYIWRYFLGVGML